MIHRKNVTFTVLMIAILSMFAFMSGCSDESTKNKDPLKGLADSSGEFEKPSVNNVITFPEAHAPHKTYQQEWWYLTANLKTEDGQSLATQWTLFRRGVEQKHWYFAHAALADTKQHLSAYRNAREELANVAITTQPFVAEIDDWRWQSNGDLLPAKLSFGSAEKKNPRKSNFTEGEGKEEGEGENNWQVKLNLSSEKPFFLQGDKGFSKKHHTLDISSHYYSQPFIKVSGDVYWQGKWQKVTGEAWLDREWGSQMLAEDQDGWDWFSLRLNEDTALMVYRIRSNQQDYLYGSLMQSNGEIRTLSASEIKLTDQSKVSSAYPQSFSIDIAQEGIKLDVEVVNNKQIMRFGIEYFEGMVTFSGSHEGDGFLEMTGYNDRL
ncbi:MAG: putative secreted hydrolase [Alteromonadaceae bacterium]|jgi:predicted secreted hydrolase